MYKLDQFLLVPTLTHHQKLHHHLHIYFFSFNSSPLSASSLNCSGVLVAIKIQIKNFIKHFRISGVLPLKQSYCVRFPNGRRPSKWGRGSLSRLGWQYFFHLLTFKVLYPFFTLKVSRKLTLGFFIQKNFTSVQYFKLFSSSSKFWIQLYIKELPDLLVFKKFSEKRYPKISRKEFSENLEESNLGKLLQIWLVTWFTEL